MDFFGVVLMVLLLWFLIEVLLFCCGCFFWVCLEIFGDIGVVVVILLWFLIEELLFCCICSLLIVVRVFIFLCKRFDFCVGGEFDFVVSGVWGSVFGFGESWFFFGFGLGEVFIEGLFWVWK